MPQFVVAVKTAWAAWTAWAAQHVVAALVIKTLVTVAISAGIGKLLGPKLTFGSLNSTSPLQVGRDPIAPRRVIYGETRVAGTLLDGFVGGASNEYLYLVVGHAGHECDSLGAVMFNDQLVFLDGADNATGTLAGFATVKSHLGTAGQAADAILVGSGQRASTDRFESIAYTMARLKWDQNIFPTGIPNISRVAKGRLCYDPRTATTAWSDNPAVCIRDYLTNVSFGLGVDAADLDDASFIEAANICDEAVALAAGGTEKRYRCNGSFETSAEPATVLEKLAESMAGSVIYIGGKWVCHAGAYRTPTITLNEDDLRAPITGIQTKLSLRDTCNRVRGTFVSPAENWQPADFTPIVNAFYLGEDGGYEIWRDLDLAFVTSHSQAQRIAKIELERTRQDISLLYPAKLTGLKVEAGDTVLINNTELGWVAKPFVVVAHKLTTYDASGELAIGCDLGLRETAAANWDWNNGEETTYDPAANTNLVDQRVVATMVGLTLNSAAAGDISALPRIRASWTLPADQFVVSGGETQLRFKKAADATWIIWHTMPGDQLVDFITDLRVGTTYNVSGRHKNSSGVWSQWCTAINLVAPPGENFDNYFANLTNDLHGIACDAEGNALAGELGVGGRAFTDVAAWVGSTGLTPVAAGPGVGQFSMTPSLISGAATYTKVDADTVRCDTITTPTAVIGIAVNLEGFLTINLSFSLVKVTSGGAYWLNTDVAAVNKSGAGVYTPATINFTALAKLLTSAPAAYAGRFIIATFNGITYTNVYTSAADESSKAYVVPAGIQAIRCRLYLAGGTATLLDEEIIPITTDGATGATGAPGAPGANGTNGAGVRGSTSGSGNSSSTAWADCCSVVVSVGAGETVAVIASGSVLNDYTSIKSVWMRILRDGSQIGPEFPYGNLPAHQDAAMNMAVSDTPGAGSHTYKAQVRTSAVGDGYGFCDSFLVI